MRLIWSKALVHDYFGCSVTLNGPVNSIQDQHGVLQSIVDMRTNDSVTIVDQSISSLLLITSCPLGTNSISGQVFLDVNGNGIHDAGENGIQGREVDLDNGSTTTTDIDGSFTFTNLQNGTYVVSENLPTNTLQTYPVGNYSVTVENGEIETYSDFGNFQKGSLGGIKFDDANGNGVRDGGEATLPNWKIYIDLNGTLNDSLLTDGSGHYAFANLGPGTYIIHEKQDPDWVQMKPGAPGYYTIDLTSNFNDDTFSFGNKQANKFTGTSSNNWSDPGNWSFGHPPDATEVVVIPAAIVIDNLPNPSVLAIRIADGGSLTYSAPGSLIVLQSFQVEVGSSLIFQTPPAATPDNIAGVTAQQGITCYGDWIVKGTFEPGNSRIIFAGDEPKTIVASKFFDLEIDGANTTTQGTVSVQNQITLLNNLTLNTNDSLIVSSSSVSAIDDDGKILGGTITRSIAPGETAPYRFKDPETYVQFNGINNPGYISMHSSDISFPTTSHVQWHVVPGTVNTTTHAVIATDISHFSTWTIGQIDGDGVPRSTINSGGGGSFQTYINSGGGGAGSRFVATLSLGYETGNLPPGTVEGNLVMLTGPYYTDTLPSSWNMVSLPVDAEDPAKSSVFPMPSSDAFSFNGVKYLPSFTLEKGLGYWVRFDDIAPIAILGGVMLEDTIPLIAGWNLVGAISYDVPVSSLSTIPPNLIEGTIFGFNHNYQPADVLRPLRSYWVRSNGSGKLIVEAPVVAKQSVQNRSLINDFNTITLTDARGYSQTVYFAGRSGYDARQFQSPPLPPAEAFDVRFSSNRYAEVPDQSTEKIVGLQIKGAAYPMTIQWNVKDYSSHPALEMNGKTVSLSSNGSLVVTGEDNRVRLKLSSAPVVALPKEFRLEQNYPNPFNPTTTIEYALPVSAHVTVSIYDVLGQEVTTLVDEVQSAGMKHVSWSGTNSGGGHVSSGLYFYKLTAISIEEGNKTSIQIKKMLLMK